MKTTSHSVRRLAILGATGSIGDSTLDVVLRHPERFEVVALAANRNWEKLARLMDQCRPKVVALYDEAAADQLAASLQGQGIKTPVLRGREGVCTVAALAEVDTVVAAITGAVGLAPCLAAAQAGKRIVVANKEALVMGGAWFMDAVRKHEAVLLPVDSEHNAVFQCLPPTGVAGVRGEKTPGVRKILLTASGGPFLNTSPEQLALVTPKDACAHPVWKMGRKISVDSATMMNKGLEVIEAHWLFGMPPDAIEVVVHPQSIIHSLVEYEDGSTLAQLGTPDMRTPIAQALAWPERIDAGVSALQLARIPQLTFQSPDFARFPCLRLAYAALKSGGGASVVLNAANECAVEAFLAERLRFTDIAVVNETTLNVVPFDSTPQSLDETIHLDAEARRAAQAVIAELELN